MDELTLEEHEAMIRYMHKTAAAQQSQQRQQRRGWADGQ
jgi:hypothetical protein